LHGKNDLEQAEQYLAFLGQKVKPDGIMIQDFSVLELAKSQGLNVIASVMMNVHNIETAKRLKELGLVQIVASREASLAYVKQMKEIVGIKMEYFAHGDMCIAHGGQCLYSGILYGKSSNRGRCMKPCRWPFNGEFPLAVKDMCMYEYIPEMIQNGVTTFKIEGRMRDFEYLKVLIDAYGDAIDRYIADPLGFDRKKHTKELYENRKRDFSTAYAFKVPGLENLNTRYEGTGKFYSTGKVFSTATEERSITAEKTAGLKEKIKHCTKVKPIKIAVRVNDMDTAKMAIDMGVDKVIIPWDYFCKSEAITKNEIEALAKNKAKIYLSTPRMMFDIDFEEMSHFLKDVSNIDGLVCTNLGAISRFKNFELIGDYQLNIFNKDAASFYLKEGLESFTVSTELNIVDLLDILEEHGDKANMVVQGSPVVMYMEHNVDEDDKITLINEVKGKHDIYKDKNGRRNMVLSKDLSMLPILKELNGAGLCNITIEAMHLEKEEVKRVLAIYKKAVENLDMAEKLYEELGENYSYGALEFED